MSLTYKGIIVTVLAWLFKYADVPVVDGNLEVFVEVATAIVGVLVTLYGRLRQNDITIFGTKRV